MKEGEAVKAVEAGEVFQCKSCREGRHKGHMAEVFSVSVNRVRVCRCPECEPVRFNEAVKAVNVKA